MAVLTGGYMAWIIPRPHRRLSGTHVDQVFRDEHLLFASEFFHTQKPRERGNRQPPSRCLLSMFNYMYKLIPF